MYLTYLFQEAIALLYMYIIKNIITFVSFPALISSSFTVLMKVFLSSLLTISTLIMPAVFHKNRRYNEKCRLLASKVYRLYACQGFIFCKGFCSNGVKYNLL